MTLAFDDTSVSAIILKVTMMLRQKVFSVIIYTICIAGCLYQVLDISKTYFAYDSKTTVSITIVSKMKIPMLSTCWDLQDVLDFKGLCHDHGFAIPNTTNEYNDLFDTLTARQVFNYTPSIDSIIKKCIVRLPRDYVYRIPEYSSSECSELFDVEKYIHRENICYKKIMKRKSWIHIIKQTLNPVEPGLIYAVFLPINFSTVISYNAIIHSKKSSMLYDAAYSPRKFIFLGNKSPATDVTFYPTEISYLPAPYGTKCIETNFSSGAEMVLKSVREKFIQKFSLVDTLAPIFTPYDYPVITGSRLRNETFVNLFRREAENAENPPCRCKLEYMVTRANAYQANYSWVNVYWPQESKNDIRYFPSFSATDYIIYVCSSIGIWFGLSVLSLFDMVQKAVTPDTKATNRIEPTGQGRENGNIECSLFSIRHTLRWQMVSIERLTNQNRQLNNQNHQLTNQTRQIISQNYQLTDQNNQLANQNHQLLNRLEKIENMLSQ